MTMTNAEWVISTGHHFKQLRIIQHNELANRTYTVALCDKPLAELKDKGEPLDVFRKWLDSEHKEPILDEAEKKYLSAVIRPFRGRAVFVKKIYHTGYTVDYEQIIIRVKSIATLIADIPLPFFKKGEMYKGMKLNREYTLEELGL